jgi:IS605 OrfB family transposase
MEETGSLVRATKTAVFRLRAPSARKRVALLDAMKRTHLATEAVLRALLAEFEHIHGLAKKRERTDFMQRLAYATLRQWTLSGAGAAAARVDAIGMVESYLQQLGDGRETANPPRILPIEGRRARYDEALAALRDQHADVAREGELRDELNRMARPGAPRPLSLHGYRHFYLLLRHSETKRLYAWINLLPSRSRFTPSIKETRKRAAGGEEMVNIADGTCIRCTKPTWMLFPLEFGFDYQERDFLRAGEPAGGRLVYRPERDEFELHAGFEFVAPAVATEGRFLGVDRGIYNLAAWSLVDRDGALLDDGAISGMELRFVQRRLEQQKREEQRRRGYVKGSTRRAQADEAVHKTANAIVRIARERNARVVVEELSLQRRLRAVPTGAKGGRFGRAARRILGRQQYAKLVQVLGYKLAVAGLPKPVSVGAAHTSTTCPECGRQDAANRRKEKAPGADVIEMSRFACVRCGHRADADRNAARVIALKGAWLTQVPTRKERGGRDLREEEKFAHYLTDAIRRRGSGGVLPVPS